MFWIIVAILTAAVAVVLMYPLMRKAELPAATESGEVAVYKDQIAELERERKSGLISDSEAEYARAEIGRRLLAADAKKTSVSDAAARTRSNHKFASAFVTVLLPAFGLCLYLLTGNPEKPDMPLEARLANPGNNIALLVAKAERHLAENPEDGAGWDILAPIYFRTMRLGDAELAYRNALRIQGVSPERLIGLGETMVAANDGIVTEDARSAFEEGLSLDATNPRARFYVGLAYEQAGKKQEALAAFEGLVKDSKADSPWLPLVNEHIAALKQDNGPTVDRAQTQTPAQGQSQTQSGTALGNPSAEDVANAQNMSVEDRQAMIQGMVDSLDARLREDPDNFEGWMRLVRSYAMLKNQDKAQEALKSGLQSFPAEGDQGKQLVALARELGLSLEGVQQ
ncbi:c-type cytochrome biogenesis protein CcmI [Agrobacterium sp.]|uniref:c-type cytochrome biogenesis protein CcmI n=1 Tax=Agrobacterium sp. TaxID=361 RepID=UPI0028A7B136|nr:c-type cytochrome biogenesis protein CcmI [Agrobacterium sp.]